MSNDSWNDGPSSGPNPQYGAGQQQGGYGPNAGHGQQSLGQGYSSNQEQAGQTGPNSGGGQQGYGNQGYQQQGYQQGYPQQGEQGQQPGGGFAPQQSGSSEPGPADLFTDIGFTKSLTGRIASLTFLVVVVWAVLRFVRVLADAWGSQDFGSTSVSRYGGFQAFMMSLEALGFLVLTVALARLLLELCVNVSRLATKRD